jgi:hypothetical protein
LEFDGGDRGGGLCGAGGHAELVGQFMPERIGMVGVTAGIYDVRVVDQNKRTCVFHHATLRPGGAYALSISEAEMKACTIGAK